MSGINNSRRELAKSRKFLNKNRNWICIEDSCGLFDHICNKCRFIDILNYSYTANPKSGILTF